MREEAGLVSRYFANMQYKYEELDWSPKTRPTGRWDRLHGDKKSQTGGEITTWVMRGSDGSYHFSLQKTNEGTSSNDKFRPIKSICRGKFDYPFTAGDLMTELRKLASARYKTQI